MDITLESVRLGLDLAQLRSEVASTNIARAGVTGARLERADFADALGALAAAAGGDSGAGERLRGISADALRRQVREAALPADAISLDDQVAELSVQGIQYRALADGLGRRFALMHLAIGGK